MASYQHEIIDQVKVSLRTSTPLNTLIGSEPQVFFNHAPDNQRPPYFVVDVLKVKNLYTAMFEGQLCVRLWFNNTNAEKASNAEEIVHNTFNLKTINGTNVRNCRLWSLSEARVQGIKKDHVSNLDVIFIDCAFDARWIVKSRIAAAEF